MSGLSIQELETFDRYAPKGGQERRFCCPLCNGNKSLDAGHRSLAVKIETGEYYCHRCKTKGVIRERQTERPQDTRRAQRRRELSRFGITTTRTPTPPDPAKQQRLNDQLKTLQSYPGSPADKYLLSRGIPTEIAKLCRVRYSPDWFGSAAVVFAFRGEDDSLTSACGRYINPEAKPKTRDAGEKKRGVFTVPNAFMVNPMIITEAPIDAMTIAAAGWPAIALGGLDCPDWIAKKAAFKTVLIATDNDQAGDDRAVKLAETIGRYGAKVYRVKPDGKDWNEMLTTSGLDAVADKLNDVFLSIPELN